MQVRYQFRFDSGKAIDLSVDTDREQDSKRDTNAEAWTRLKHCQCSNCPLSEQKHPHCPVALDMQEVVKEFRSEKAFQKVEVIVTTRERTYQKRTGLEEGLRSLLGLVMATSECPILAELKPMAMHHVPFATSDEFILRSVSSYLLQQYFVMKDGQTPDWQLNGLVERNRSLQLVNQALWQRIHDACEEDSNLKALLSFFSLASSVTFSLESQLNKLRQTFEDGNWHTPQSF